MTRRQILRLAAATLVLAALLLYAAAHAQHPCNGLSGGQYQSCIDLNYPHS